MHFRIKAFFLHLLSSAVALTVILGSLYLGWYRWPGWYLANATQVVAVMAGVDVVLGPLLTLVIAAPGKPRAVLRRDLSMIVAVQLLALGFGTASLWNGRPLYYAFSGGQLQLTQAYDISAEEAAAARQSNPDFAPHWYRFVRWISVQAHNDAQGQPLDVTNMPRFFQSWERGLPELRKQLAKPDNVGYFFLTDKKILKAKMQADGLPTEQANSMVITGRAQPLLTVFDPATLSIIHYYATRKWR